MPSGPLPQADADRFVAATERLRRVRLRPGVSVEEVPAPGRLAPMSLALSAEVSGTDDEELASGRFVLLFDPAEPTAWGGVWRVVTYARAVLEPELATDPLLGEVGWTWLGEALDGREAAYDAVGGTVTRVISERFGTLADESASVELEVRASWTPSDDALEQHLAAWIDLLGTLGGLPPMPEGVSLLSSVQI